MAGPADGGGAPQGHVPQPRHHRQEAGQRAGQSGGRHPPQQEAGGDESEMELPQGEEYGHKVRENILRDITKLFFTFYLILELKTFYLIRNTK